MSVLFGAFGALIGLLAVGIVGYLYLDFSFLPGTSCGERDNYVYCFFDETWDSETYLSIITGFYSTIIILLLGLLGVVVAFAFIVIRGSALQRAEETIATEVGRYFGSTVAEKRIHEAVNKIGGTELRSLRRRLDDTITELVEKEYLGPEQLNFNDGYKDEEKTEQTD